MKYKFLFITLLAIGIAGLYGCSKDDDGTGDGPCATAWSVAVQDEVSAWSSAAQAYGMDPTTENCNAYKAAADAYLDALEPYENCAALAGQQRAEWKAALDAARESINNMNCQ